MWKLHPTSQNKCICIIFYTPLSDMVRQVLEMLHTRCNLSGRVSTHNMHHTAKIRLDKRWELKLWNSRPDHLLIFLKSCSEGVWFICNNKIYFNLIQKSTSEIKEMIWTSSLQQVYFLFWRLFLIIAHWHKDFDFIMKFSLALRSAPPTIRVVKFQSKSKSKEVFLRFGFRLKL